MSFFLYFLHSKLIKISCPFFIGPIFLSLSQNLNSLFVISKPWIWPYDKILKTSLFILQNKWTLPCRVSFVFKTMSFNNMSVIPIFKTIMTFFMSFISCHSLIIFVLFSIHVLLENPCLSSLFSLTTLSTCCLLLYDIIELLFIRPT